MRISAIYVSDHRLMESMFLYDHGGNQKHHGVHNMIVFVVPAIAVASVEYELGR